MRAGVAASAPMALTPSFRCQVRAKDAPKNRRREANYINMVAPGMGAVNRNECEDRKFFGEFDRISRCIVSHKRYSRPRGHFRRFACGSAWGNAGALGPERQRQEDRKSTRLNSSHSQISY